MTIVPLKINQMFNGMSPSQYFGLDGTYLNSISVDPDYPISSSSARTSGFAVPIGYAKFSGSNVTSAVIKIINSPKNTLTYAILSNGRIISYDNALGTETLVGTVAGGNAGGAEYYNNYIYIFGTGSSKNDVSRYGPLDNSPTLTDGVWTGATLGSLSALSNTTYPTLRSVSIPNHWGYVHGDGSLYFLDFESKTGGSVPGKGLVHRINTRKVPNGTVTVTIASPAVFSLTAHGLVAGSVVTFSTTGALPTGLTAGTNYYVISAGLTANAFEVSTTPGGSAVNTSGSQSGVHTVIPAQGDANGSVTPSQYNVLTLPFGFYPTSITSVSTNIMIIGIYTTDNTISQGKAAFIMWDPTNTTSFFLGPVPLADSLATACLNADGSVFIWSGNAQNGSRLSKYFGGEQVSDVVLQEEGLPPLAGAVDFLGSRVVWGGYTTTPNDRASAFAWGSKDVRLPSGLHNIAKASTSGTTPIVTALKYVQQDSYKQPKIVMAWNDASAQGIDSYSSSATLGSVMRWMFNVGQKFEIKRIRIPLAGAVNSTTNIQATVYFDDFSSNPSNTLPTINNTNFSGKRKILYKGATLNNYTGINNFVLELVWSNTNPLPVGFPILIDIDVKDDEPM